MASVQLSINNATQNQIKFWTIDKFRDCIMFYEWYSVTFLRQSISLFFFCIPYSSKYQHWRNNKFYSICEAFILQKYYRNITSTFLCNITHYVYICSIYIHTYIHTYIQHTYIHTYIYTHCVIVQYTVGYMYHHSNVLHTDVLVRFVF